MYLLTRYIVFGIQLFSSLYIAARLGPYYFGKWGFILLIINFLTYLNLGIDKSLNIFLVQKKEDDLLSEKYVHNSLLITSGIILFILLLSCVFIESDIPILDKYQVSPLLLFIGIIGSLYHLNNLYGTISRVKNRLLEITFFQSVIPIFTLICLFLAEGESLFFLLIGALLLGHLTSLIFFILKSEIKFKLRLDLEILRKIIAKSIYLFAYNLIFTLILLSTRFIISSDYSIEEFGFFTLAFTLSNSILLILQTFASIALPKIIDKLSLLNDEVSSTIEKININYTTGSYLFIFLGLVTVPVLLKFLPQYSGVNMSFNFAALAIIIITNSLGPVSFLMAQNREKYLSVISLFCLCINILLSYSISRILNGGYEYVILSSLVSYFLFGVLCTERSKSILSTNNLNKSINFFPNRLIVPFVIAIALNIKGLYSFMFIPFGIFVLMNWSEIRDLVKTAHRIWLNPRFIDI